MNPEFVNWPSGICKQHEDGAMSFEWTDKRKEKLRELWGREPRLSAADIAEKLGEGVTRNAVIGMVRRMGLEPRKRVSSAPLVKRIRRARARQPLIAIFRPPATVEISSPEHSARLDRLIPMAQRCTIMMLNDNTCRFPIGDSRDKEFFFCGGVPQDGSPYCLRHHDLCHQPIRSRVRAAA